MFLVHLWAFKFFCFVLFKETEAKIMSIGHDGNAKTMMKTITLDKAAKNLCSLVSTEVVYVVNS
jgi:hypothetical protein